MQTPEECKEIFITAARCAECDNAACINACPDKVDLRALFEFIAAQAPMPIAWMTQSQQAEAFAGEAINNSFEA